VCTVDILTSIVFVAIIPKRRPGNRAGATPFTSIPFEMAHLVKAICSLPGDLSIFLLLILSLVENARC
jgi:hypothetical protein